MLSNAAVSSAENSLGSQRRLIVQQPAYSTMPIAPRVNGRTGGTAIKCSNTTLPHTSRPSRRGNGERCQAQPGLLSTIVANDRCRQQRCGQQLGNAAGQRQTTEKYSPSLASLIRCICS